MYRVANIFIYNFCGLFSFYLLLCVSSVQMGSGMYPGVHVKIRTKFFPISVGSGVSTQVIRFVRQVILPAKCLTCIYLYISSQTLYTVTILIICLSVMAFLG